MKSSRNTSSLVVLALLLAGACNAQIAGDASALLQVAMDTRLVADERLKALDRAANIDPNAAEHAATTLIRDASEPVAVAAAQLLADAVVMSNHPAADPAYLSQWQIAVMERHNAAKEALKIGLSDPRRGVRDIAASTLSALSDTNALDSINAGVATGLYKQIEAVNYFGQAQANIGADYIMPYLAEGTDGAKQAAVQYLGRNTTYQNIVRDEVLLDDTETSPVRESAASVLGRYDPNFANYAAPLLQTTSLPPGVYSEIVDKYLAVKPQLTDEEMQQIHESVEFYSEQDIEPDTLQRLNQQLQETERLRTL